jgi:hypothetical protein
MNLEDVYNAGFVQILMPKSMVQGSHGAGIIEINFRDGSLIWT